MGQRLSELKRKTNFLLCIRYMWLRRPVGFLTGGERIPMFGAGMNIKFLFGLVLLMAAWPGSVKAESDDEALISAMNNMQHEVTTCWAYYNAVQACMKGDENDKLRSDYSKASDSLQSTAFEIGEALGMTYDAMLSRMRLEAARQRTLLNGNCVNVSSLISRHADRCEQVIEDPDSVLAEFMGGNTQE